MGIPTNEQNLAPGADAVADTVRVERQFLPVAISTAATTLVKSGSGCVGELFVAGGTMGTVTIYDSLTATGALLLPTVTVVQGGLLLRDVVFNVGLTVVTSAATVIVGGYR